MQPSGGLASSAALTVDRALAQATGRLATAGSESPRLDAEVLLGHVLGVDRTVLRAHPEAPLGAGQVVAFEERVVRRSAGEPVAYIRGMKEFYGLALLVDRRVLIPRPETETLVELALDRIRRDLTSASRPADAPPYLVWDVGTGSGAIAIAIATHLRRRRYGRAVAFHLTDSSAEAISVALENAAGHGVADVMTFGLGDLTDVEPRPAGPADLLVANLPYVPTASLDSLPIAASYEPRSALDGGEDGLDTIRRLLPQLPGVLSPAGAAVLEIGGDQEAGIRSAAAAALPDWACDSHQDLSGSPRVVTLERPGA